MPRQHELFNSPKAHRVCEQIFDMYQTFAALWPSEQARFGYCTALYVAAGHDKAYWTQRIAEVNEKIDGEKE